MKKWILPVLSAFLAFAPLAAGAENPCQSLSDLRSQAPERWTQTFETQWRTVNVDAPILLPDGDAVPIVTVGYDTRPLPQAAETGGWEHVEKRDGCLLLYNDDPSVPRKVNGQRINRAPESQGMWFSGFAPQNTYVPLSDISFGEICGQINGELVRFGYDPSDFSVATPNCLWTQHWYYYGVKRDALPGQLFLQTCQKIAGLPLLCHIWSAVCDHGNGEARGDEYFELPEAGLTAYYNGYSARVDQILLRALSLQSVLADDVPLCSLQKVQSAIEREIENGHIRKVYELKFGYALYNEPGLYREKGSVAPPYDTLLYYAKPVWQVNCLYADAATGLLHAVSEGDSERNSLDYRRLIIDAQTGEQVMESNAKDRCEYKGFLGWDDVGGKR